jgi:poly(A) polymerase
MRPLNIQIDQDWLSRPSVQDVMQALTKDGGVARFVGGCVRDALFHRPVRDIDIATDQTPDRVIALLGKAGLRHAPTGLAHGTVTAIAGGQGFEVTTLRVDHETDGRRAKVSFTDDWLADAQRRDFTMNALYCDPDGTVYDPVGGIDDIAAHHVRFIGDAAARIEEDYLRILRFFRFHAGYGEGSVLDPLGFAACADHKDGLASLSVERIRGEFLRLLESPNPAQTLDPMKDAGVLGMILPVDADLQALDHLVSREQAAGTSSVYRRLTALFSGSLASLPGHATAWKMSNAEKKQLRSMAKARDVSAMDLLAARAAIYRGGKQIFIDDLILWSGRLDKDLLDMATQWTVPTFPLNGSDVLSTGMAPGQQVGDILQTLEDYWIAEGFGPDRDSLLARLKFEASR